VKQIKKVTGYGKIDGQTVNTTNFLEECTFMRKLQTHKNVVNFIGFCEDPLCLVTEYCENGSLKSLLDSNKPVDMGLKLRILTDVAAGMYHLQNEQIVHRDLAARNCLLTDNFVTKVGDFGLSKIIGDDLQSTAEYGTWPIKWLAPEVLSSKIFNHSADVWSYGILCIEVFTRKDPYPSFTLEEFARRVILEDLPKTARNYIPTDTHPLLEQICIECLSVNPSKRPLFSEIFSRLEVIQL